MPNEVLRKQGTAICWADTTDYTPGTAKPARTAQIDLTSLADGSARQGVKVDLGATFSDLYSIHVDYEWNAPPTAGNRVSLYFGWSYDTTAGDGNPALMTGADAAYTGYNSNIAASLAQADGPYIFMTSARVSGNDDQRGNIGLVRPLGRYVSIVVFNQSGTAFIADATEMYVALLPMTAEIQ